MSQKVHYTPADGNLFAELGLPDAEELLAKTDLAIHIGRIIEERRLTQAQAADLMGIDQPKVSALMRGRLEGFSLERLYRYLNALGRDIEIVVRPKPHTRSKGVVRVLAQSARTPAAAKTAPRSAPRKRSAKRVTTHGRPLRQ